MNFENDLSFGNEYERKLIDYIEHDKYIIKEGYFPYYDIKFKKDGKKTRYEVKADRLSYKTCNMAIEFECSNKPSGIQISRSDYYAYFVLKPNNNYDLYIIPTKKIKKEINKENYKKIINGGDGGRSRMYLFNLGTFHKYKI